MPETPDDRKLISFITTRKKEQNVKRANSTVNTGYLAKIKSYPKQEEHILVMRNRGNNELAPSSELLSKWKNEEINWS